MQNKKLSSIYLKSIWIIILASIILLVFINLYLLELINKDKVDNIYKVQRQIHMQKDVLDEGMTLMFNNVYLQRSFIEDLINKEEYLDRDKSIWEKFKYEKNLKVSSLDMHINEIEKYFGNIIINGKTKGKDKEFIGEIESLNALFKFQHYLNTNSMFDSWSSYYSVKGYLTLYPFGSAKDNINSKEEIFKAINMSINQLNNLDDPQIIKNGWDTSAFYDNTESVIMFSKNLPVQKNDKIEGIITNSIEINNIQNYIKNDNPMISIYVIDGSGSIVYNNGEDINKIQQFSNILQKEYYIENVNEILDMKDMINSKNTYFFNTSLENVDWKIFYVVDSKWIDKQIPQKILFLTFTNIILVSIIMTLIYILKKNNQELNKIENLKNEFLLTISHDLKAPLASILGFAEMINAKFNREIIPIIDSNNSDISNTAKRINRNLSIIEKEGNRLTYMINNLLDLTKLESKEIRIQKKRISPPDLLEEVVTRMSSLIKKRNLDLIVQIQPNMPDIFVDVQMIRQVLENLISNAIKFTRDGVIICSVYKKESNFFFEVKDTGIGIEDYQQIKIFDKFVRINTSDLAGNKGSGLGLAICKNIIELHNGQIWVNSAIDKGSTFIFTIPMESFLDN